MPWLVAASMALRVSTSQTASWKDAATSWTSMAAPARCWVSTQRATAVLRPLKEKSKRCRSRSRPAGEPAREVDGHAVAAGGGAVDVRPAREGQPEQAGDLVEGLARRVVDGRRPAARRRWSRPRRAAGWSGRRETSIARHGSGSGPCSSWSTATWAARWLTPYSGLPRPRARALALATPTSSAPASPGPLVTAIGVDVAQRDPGGLAGPLDGRAPSPRGAPGWRPRARPRRSGRARRRCWRRRRRAGCARARCRRRSRRRRSRCRARGVRHSWRHCPRRRAVPGRASPAAGRARPSRRGSSGAARSMRAKPCAA